MSRVYQEKNIIKKTLAYYVCDSCGNSISLDQPVYSFNSHHFEWDNDSIESYNYFDVCSGGCYLSILQDEIANNKEYRTYTIDGKPIAIANKILSEPTDV